MEVEVEPQTKERPAEARDFLSVAQLLGELGRGQVAPDTEAIFRERYLRHLARPDTASLVAEVDGQVVGFLSLEFRERLNRPLRDAWIPDLIVAESARGRGFGRALLERAFAIAREHGCYRVTLESGYSREVAHRLYRAAGMRDEGLFFGIELAER